MKNFLKVLYMVVGGTILLLMVLPLEICREICYRRKERRKWRGREFK